MSCMQWTKAHDRSMKRLKKAKTARAVFDVCIDAQEAGVIEYEEDVPVEFNKKTGKPERFEWKPRESEGSWESVSTHHGFSGAEELSKAALAELKELRTTSTVYAYRGYVITPEIDEYNGEVVEDGYRIVKPVELLDGGTEAARK